MKREGDNGAKSRLYHYGLGVGVPYQALNSIANAVDTARNATDLARRRKLAQEMLARSPWKGFIDKTRGYSVVTPDTLPGTKPALEAARAIIEDRRKTGWKARQNNPFFQCERPEDFLDYPALLDFALSDAMLEIVSDYYGMVPQMKEVGIWLTPPQDGSSAASSSISTSPRLRSSDCLSTSRPMMPMSAR